MASADPSRHSSGGAGARRVARRRARGPGGDGGLRVACRRLAETSYSWDASVDRLEATLVELAG